MTEHEILEKIDELKEILREGHRNADQLMLPSESQARAQNLMRQALGIIEEITGEEWEFSYISW